MTYYQQLILQPMSLRILEYVFENNEQKAEEIGRALDLTARQVDAAVSKSLQRYGLAHRLGKLTPLKKKMYNVIAITENGRKYIEWRKQNDSSLGL